MEITRPTLPPLAGYVEVIDENGKHVYKPTPETVDRMKASDSLKQKDNEILELQKALDVLLGVNVDG